jgi:hypothetical protein
MEAEIDELDHMNWVVGQTIHFHMGVIGWAQLSQTQAGKASPNQLMNRQYQAHFQPRPNR